MVTRYKTYREDTLKKSAFERYTKKHYDSWVTFARDKEYGDDVEPVLVSGFDTTKDFAMALPLSPTSLSPFRCSLLLLPLSV